MTASVVSPFQVTIFLGKKISARPYMHSDGDTEGDGIYKYSCYQPQTGTLTPITPTGSNVMGRVCMCRVCYVPSSLCAEFVMGRVCHVPSLLCAELSNIDNYTIIIRIDPIARKTEP